jgi:hypothetical protein
MSAIYMKIHGYDEASSSLLVSFASDKTKYQDPSMYPAYAYQPMKMWPDIEDMEVIKKRIALAGLSLTEDQAREEKFIADPVKVEQYKDLIGKEFSFDPEILISAGVV